MNEKIVELEKLSYQFFPKGKSDRDEVFWISEEYIKLKSFLNQKNSFVNVLNSLIKSMKTNFGDLMIEEMNNSIPSDRCVKIKFFINNEKSYLMLYVSILIPYYIIYESLLNKKVETFDEFLEKKYVQKKISDGYEQICSKVELCMKHLLPEYQLMSQEIFSHSVPDIVYNGNGVLNNFLPSKYSTPMTIFNVFFSDNYF
jgi:hypothetical protein